MRGALLWAIGCLWAWPSGVAIGAEVAAGVSIRAGEVESFHLAVREHYHVSEADLVAVRKAKVRDDDLPVVLHIAQRAKCSPSAVVELRAGGKSWMEVSTHLGLGVEVFHVEVDGDYGPPYGRALGHFKHRKRHEWGRIRLSDEDVGLLVHLRFLSARHGCTPADVIQLHVGGDSIVSLHGKLKARKRHAQPSAKAAVGSGGGASALKAKGRKSGSVTESTTVKASPGPGNGRRAAASKESRGGRGGSRGGKK